MSQRNWIILAVVVVVLVAGYLAWSTGAGDTTTAPAEPPVAEQPADTAPDAGN